MCVRVCVCVCVGVWVCVVCMVFPLSQSVIAQTKYILTVIRVSIYANTNIVVFGARQALRARACTGLRARKCVSEVVSECVRARRRGRFHLSRDSYSTRYMAVPLVNVWAHTQTRTHIPHTNTHTHTHTRLSHWDFQWITISMTSQSYPS